MTDDVDGGGVRGLWSLLVLQKLMKYIAEEEEKNEYYEEGDALVYHSFHPQNFPFELSTAVDLSSEERQKYKTAGDNYEAKIRALPEARRYLPCHYFDYICGSSTGA